MGYEADTARGNPGEIEACAFAIVNLSDPQVSEQIAQLQAAAKPIIGHAGHKDVAALDLGRAAGCDVVATNGMATHHLASLIEQALQLKKSDA